MAIAFDAVSAANQYTTGTSLTFAHTCGASANILLVGVGVAGNQDVSGVTYNGVALTLVKRQSFDWANGRAELWYLLNPATGSAHNVVISLASSQIILGSSVSYAGVDVAGTPLGTAVSAGANDPSTPFTVNASSATGELVVDACAMKNGDGTALIAGAGQTRRGTSDEDTMGHAEAQSEEAGAATVTMSYTHAAGAKTWGIIAVPLKPAGGGGSTYYLPQIMGTQIFPSRTGRM